MEECIQSDISREGITTAKLSHFLRVLFSSEATQVLSAHNKFGDIDFEQLWESGKRGIILDVDECIAPHHGDILPENIEVIRSLVQSNWKIVIFSNMKKSFRYTELENLGVQVITSQFAKPDERGFLESVSALGIEKGNVVMIGDNFLTDGGSIQSGIGFIKIKPIETQDAKRGLSRAIQLRVRRLVDGLAQFRGNLNYR